MSIRIKRSQTTAVPSSLDEGQLAYSENSGNLFIGTSGATVTKIGGNTDVTKLSGIAAGAEANVVDSVAGRIGDVVITASDLADFNTSADARIAAADIENLSNVQGTPSDGQVLTWNNSGNYYEPQAAGTGVTTFVALNDSPTNYTGSGGFFVRVNSGATALEFTEDVDDGTF